LVLLVDDEPCMLRIYQCILHRYFKARVMTTQHGGQALQLASERRPCLVISDLNHPGLNGLELTQELLRLYARLPVVLISGAMSAGIQAEAKAAGVSACLTKPFAIDEFLRVLRRVSRRR
jgi:CheY-like chemotaxis protein